MDGVLQVFSWMGEQLPDRNRPLDTYYDDSLGRLMTYSKEVAVLYVVILVTLMLCFCVIAFCLLECESQFIHSIFSQLYRFLLSFILIG